MTDLGGNWTMHEHWEVQEKCHQKTSEGDNLCYQFSGACFFAHFNIFEIGMVISSIFGVFFFSP